MFSCLKITLPLSSVISAVRRSHSNCVKRRDRRVAKDALKTQAAILFSRRDLGRRESDLRFLAKVVGCRPGLSWIIG